MSDSSSSSSISSISSSLNFLGSYSGITMSTIEQLLQIDAIPYQRMSDNKDSYQKQENAWKDINTKISTLSSKLFTLKLNSTFKAKTVTSSNDKIVTAAAGSGALNGTYSLSNISMAKAASIISNKIIGPGSALSDKAATDPLGISTTMYIQANGVQKTVDVSINDSLNDIVNKINSLDKNIGDPNLKINITASVFDGRLMIQNNKTGNSSNIQISDGGTGTLGSLGLSSTITQNNTITSGVIGTDAAAPLHLTGNFTVTVNGKTATVKLVDGSTMNDIKTQTDAVFGADKSPVTVDTSAGKITFHNDDGPVILSAVDDNGNAISGSNTILDKLKLTSTSGASINWQESSMAGVPDTLNLSGDLVLTAGGVSYTINLNGKSLSDLPSLVNTTTGGNITLSVDNTSGSNKIVLNSSKGPVYFSANNAGSEDILGTLKLSQPAVSGEIYNYGSNATFTLNGLSFSRETNVVSDIISGVTFNLKGNSSQDTTSTVQTITIDNDASKAIDAVKAFIDQYNTVLDTIRDDLKYGADDTEEDAVLAGNPTLQMIQSNLMSKVRGIINTGNSAITKLSDIGITTQDVATKGSDGKYVFDYSNDGHLKLDEDTFKEALTNDPDAVKALFFGEKNVAKGAAVTGSGTNIVNITNGDTTDSNPCTISGSININLGTLVNPSRIVLYTPTLDPALTLTNFSVYGYNGSNLVQNVCNVTDNTSGTYTMYTYNMNIDNLQVTSPDANKQILEVEVYQNTGVVSDLDSYLNSLTQYKTGTISAQEDGLSETIDDLSKRMDDFKDKLEDKRQYYIQIYSALDTAMQQSQSMQSWLTQQIAGFNK